MNEKLSEVRDLRTLSENPESYVESLASFKILGSKISADTISEYFLTKVPTTHFVKELKQHLQTERLHLPMYRLTHLQASLQQLIKLGFMVFLKILQRIITSFP